MIRPAILPDIVLEPAVLLADGEPVAQPLLRDLEPR